MEGYYDNYNINYHNYKWSVWATIRGIPTLAKGRFPIVYALESAYIELCSIKTSKPYDFYLRIFTRKFRRPG
jgi:hypothetical protein